MEKALAKRRTNLVPVEPAAPAITPMTILDNAIAKGVDIDQLQKLMDMVQQWEKNQAQKAFFDALTTFQTKVPVIKKNKKADIRSDKGSYSYKFTDLGSIANAIKEPLKECGLSYRWAFKTNNGNLIVTCYISHRDGHTEATEMEAGKDSSGGKNAIQQVGSTQTYLQRYTLIGALGLSTADEDNDGRGNPSANQAQLVQTEDEILGQWQQSVDATNSRVELTALYMKNRKVVDKNPKVQAIFKARQEKLPVFDAKKTELP